MKVFVIALATLATLAPVAPALAFHEEAGRAVGDVVDHLRGLGSRLEQQLIGPGTRGPDGSAAAERPLITFILDRRHELALTPDQVTRLEALRQGFSREAIRRDADIRVAELDLAGILDHDPVDVAKAEAKMLEVARLRAQLRVERLKAIEQGKAVLTPEQRGRLQTLLGAPPGSARRASDGGRTRL